MRLPAAIAACLLATNASAAGEYNCLIEAYESVEVKCRVRFG